MINPIPAGQHHSATLQCPWGGSGDGSISPREGRTSACTPAEAATLRDKARKFVEVADLLIEEEEGASISASAAVSVLGAIAASDAICGRRLGRRSKGQDHNDAIQLLKQVEPGGEKLANALARVLAVKNASQYGTKFIDRPRAQGVLRQAHQLLDAAEEALA